MARFGKLGWFLGLIFGALFGVLFAPRKGKELRGKIKADRKKGNLGIAPLQDDLKNIGQEIADIAKDFYDSETVQDVVEKGRKKFKSLSDELVGEVADFHYSKIKPLREEVKEKVRKAKASVKIGKKAIRDIKKVMKKNGK